MIQAPTRREAKREQILQELLEMADRLASAQRSATPEEMEAYFRKAEELPLAGPSQEDVELT